MVSRISNSESQIITNFWTNRNNFLAWIMVSSKQETNAAITCHNDELSWSLSWLDYLQTDSEFFYPFAENNQIPLKIFLIPILFTFMYLEALYQKKLTVNNFKSTKTRTQLIIMTDNCSMCHALLLLFWSISFHVSSNTLSGNWVVNSSQLKLKLNPSLQQMIAT